MAIVTGDRYLDRLVKFVEENAGALIEGPTVLKLNPAGLHYVQSRLEALHELESLLTGAPVDYLRAYVSDLGDHRALEQLRRILRLLPSLKVVSVLPHPARDPTPLSLLPFARLRVLELRGCDLSTSAAKGLLELHHTLEKITCLNSTDALRHVFASRIVEIKNSPQWLRLSFVSCACNRLVLMDESLQLLPAIETLDLSRNRFAKVDNLRKCTKLKNLDLGFNHLRTISPLSEISFNLVKLVVRNNALSTLHGIQNLRSLEALDVSYNIISNFSEVELIGGLPSLQNLWLEGNPLCCARWYRAQAFSYFGHPEVLKLDDKVISAREFWKRQIIISSRQKLPASFGFYCPATDDPEGEDTIAQRRRKISRLASIESSDDSTSISSDQESVSCENENQPREEQLSSEDKAEIAELISKVELMKKERSVLWLREVKKWMDPECENVVDTSNSGPTLHRVNENPNHVALGESSKQTANSSHTLVGQVTNDLLESKKFPFDVSTIPSGGVAVTGKDRSSLEQKFHQSSSHEGFRSAAEQVDLSIPLEELGTLSQGCDTPLVPTDCRSECYSSSAYPGSPPHYQEDILQRRHNLVEEVLQLSADSFSVLSSDSNTTSSEDDEYDDVHEVDKLMYGDGWPQNSKCLNSGFGGHGTGREREDDVLSTSNSEGISYILERSISNHSVVPASSVHEEVASEHDVVESKRKPRRRFIPLPNDVCNSEIRLADSCGNSCACEADMKFQRRMSFGSESGFPDITDRKQFLSSATASTDGRFLSDEFIEEYFKAHIGDSSVEETCRYCVCCDCVMEPRSLSKERQVALLVSSQNKLYVLLIGVAFDGSGQVSLLNWHRMEDVREILVGFGLQVIRVSIEKGATYLFRTGSVKKASQLLSILQVLGPCTSERTHPFIRLLYLHHFSFCEASPIIQIPTSSSIDLMSRTYLLLLYDRKGYGNLYGSLEQVQVQFFEKEICGGSKMSIFQYSLVLFSDKESGEGTWLSRSLFIAGGNVVVCLEDFKHFSSSLSSSSRNYFSLDSHCSIGGIIELVIDAKSRCVTLAIECAAVKSSSSAARKERPRRKETEALSEPATSGSLTWKLKWYSDENLLNFVALLKAIHAGMSAAPMIVSYLP